MYAVLKAIHYTSLLVLAGGPFFWFFMGRSVWSNLTDETVTGFAQRVRLGVLLGAAAFVISGLAEAVRAASLVVDPTQADELWLFLSASRYGQMSLLKALLAPVFALGFLASYRAASSVAVTGTAIIGLGLLGTISFTSHAAARPDVIPLVSDIVHILAAVIWGGGLLYFAILPWRLIHANLPHNMRSVARLFERFSTLAMIVTLVLAATGAIAAYLHVYGPEALTVTPYGRTLLGKLAMFSVALGIASVHLLMIGPALNRQVRRFTPQPASMWMQRLRLMVQIEAGLIIVSMVLAGVLTTFNPAERPGHIVRNDWQRQLGERQVHLSMRPTNEIGGVQFELKLQSTEGVPEPPGTQASLYMRMVDHDMGLSELSATPIGAGDYTASGLITMAGDWQVELRVQPPLSPPLNTTVNFEAPTGALELGRIRRLDFAAISFSWINTLTVVMGALIICLAGFTIWASKRGKLPLWAIPFGLFLIICGGALGLNVVLVDAYPTSLRRNPLPPSEAVVKRGEMVFQTHCSVCHGAQGRGDGPAAASLNPKPADLTAVHVDDHTDGDLFWWLNYGIAGTAMPSFEQILSDTNRWELIRYIRSLRDAGT